MWSNKLYMEIYKDVIGYEGKYKISNLGNVFSYPKSKCRKEKILKPMLLRNGYLRVDLCKDKTVTRLLIHRLVAEAFIENPENKYSVNHKNGIKSDNCASNLEWSTRSENQKHAILTGLRTAKGIKNSQSKLKESEVISIFDDVRPYALISKEYNISIPTISDIKRGHTWTHITLNRVKS